MKNHSILFFLLSLFSSLTHASAITARALEPRASCAADNCLRALSNAYTSTASAFCATYTTKSTATIPSYATSGCANNPSRVSSACSCLATSYGQPKPLRRVYGGTNGIDGTEYTNYTDSVNIRSDPLYDRTPKEYDMYLNNCRQMCGYYGNDCQTISFVIEEPYDFYLCYVMRSKFDPKQIVVAEENRRNVVEERYQT